MSEHAQKPAHHTLSSRNHIFLNLPWNRDHWLHSQLGTLAHCEMTCATIPMVLYAIQIKSPNNIRTKTPGISKANPYSWTRQSPCNPKYSTASMPSRLKSQKLGGAGTLPHRHIAKRSSTTTMQDRSDLVMKSTVSNGHANFELKCSLLMMSFARSLVVV